MGPPGSGGDPIVSGRFSLFRDDDGRREAYVAYLAARAEDPSIGPPPTWAQARYSARAPKPKTTTRKGKRR
jgi:hypothetical protein